jgi:hypothetical protein
MIPHFEYFKSLAESQFDSAVKDIEHCYNTKGYSSHEKTCFLLEWFLKHHNSDSYLSTALYSFTKEAFWSQNPTEYLAGLASFIINCVYDDSYYRIEYRDYPDEYYDYEREEHFKIFEKGKTVVRQINGVFDYDEKKMFLWEPVLLWVNDSEEGSTQDPRYIDSAIRFIESQHKRYEKEGI